MDTEDRLLTIRQAAEYLSVSEVSLRRWTDSGRMPCLRVGARRERRFRRGDLIAFSEGEAPVAADDAQPLTPSDATDTPKATMDLEGLSIDYSSHLCALYESDNGRTKMAVPFLKDGLRLGDSCFLVARPEVNAQLLGELRRAGALCDRALKTGQLQVWEGFESVEDALRTCAASFIESLREGRKAIRVVGDMAWFFHKGMEFDDLESFEMRYNHKLAHSYPVVSLCLYDARAFSGQHVLSALRCHEDTFNYPLARFLGP